jgi:molecular chaperone GrpE
MAEKKSFSEKFKRQVNDPQNSSVQANEVAQESELDVLKKENADLNSKLLLVAADYDNYKKRIYREQEENKKFAITSIAKELIDVLENLYRAEESIDLEKLHNNETLKQIFTGVELTKKSLLDVMAKHGIKRINPHDEQFDHNFHQAITEIESQSHKNGQIVQVVQAGYILNDRLIRPALVVVAKSKG